jgi:hypothetical protein
MSRTSPVTKPNAPAPQTGGGGAGGKAAAPNCDGEMVRARAPEDACEGVGGCCTMGTGPLGLEGGGGACGILGRAPPNDVMLSPCCWRAAPGDTVRAGSTGRKGERLRELVPGRRNWFSSMSSKFSSGAGSETTTEFF